ncbi:helix-turn-helix transcriptional regulator [Nocardia sp. NPDC004711]
MDNIKQSGTSYRQRKLVKMADSLNALPEALKRIPVSRSKFYELMRSGEIGSVKVGARRFIADSQIDAFIQRLARESEDLAVRGEALVASGAELTTSDAA